MVTPYSVMLFHVLLYINNLKNVNELRTGKDIDVYSIPLIRVTTRNIEISQVFQITIFFLKLYWSF
jgi:hypothetical protein